jgi:hypothetical protein
MMTKNQPPNPNPKATLSQEEFCVARKMMVRMKTGINNKRPNNMNSPPKVV